MRRKGQCWFAGLGVLGGGGKQTGTRDTYVGLAAQVRLAPHEVSGATEAATVYEIVAGAQGRFSMVAQVGRHSTG